MFVSVFKKMPLLHFESNEAECKVALSLLRGWNYVHCNRNYHNFPC